MLVRYLNELRIIIAGSRDFDNYKVLEDESSKIIEKELNDDIQSIRIISGTARGADQLGERFAKKYNYSISCFPAEWGLYGKSAGYRRNAEMAKFAVSNNNVGILIAFWDSQSKGTKHMIDLANRYGLKVYVIKFNKENRYV